MPEKKTEPKTSVKVTETSKTTRKPKAAGFKNRREQIVAARYGPAEKDPMLTVEEYIALIGQPAVLIGGLTNFIGGRAFPRRKTDWNRIFYKFNKQ